jgi:hypothetical protein
MEPTGTVVVSALVGAGIGYAIARLTFHPSCPPHVIVVNPASTPKALGDVYVCKQAGHGVRWESSNGARIAVVWSGVMDPPTAPRPYTLNCSNAATSSCDSGALAANAAAESKSPFELTVTGVAGTWNGRIIIDK